MAERDDGRDGQPEREAEYADDRNAGASDDLPEGVKAIPPDAWKGPGGCGFTGCMYTAMIVAALMLALLVIGLLTREWIVPPVSPRG